MFTCDPDVMNRLMSHVGYPLTANRIRARLTELETENRALKLKLKELNALTNKDENEQAS